MNEDKKYPKIRHAAKQIIRTNNFNPLIPGGIACYWGPDQIVNNDPPLYSPPASWHKEFLRVPHVRRFIYDEYSADLNDHHCPPWELIAEAYSDDYVPDPFAFSLSGLNLELLSGWGSGFNQGCRPTVRCRISLDSFPFTVVFDGDPGHDSTFGPWTFVYVITRFKYYRRSSVPAQIHEYTYTAQSFGVHGLISGFALDLNCGLGLGLVRRRFSETQPDYSVCNGQCSIGLATCFFNGGGRF